jgi:hypothetical protein
MRKSLCAHENYAIHAAKRKRPRLWGDCSRANLRCGNADGRGGCAVDSFLVPRDTLQVPHFPLTGAVYPL